MGKICVDGNTACAKIAYKVNELALIYPITPSSAMAEYCDKMSFNQEKNYLGNELKVVEMQSESGVAGAIHGSLKAGALTTTFTCSQGLLLMIPNMYKIAGELLPTVFHVSARSIATHALSIFCDHSDVMACRATGFLMLASSGVQECQDMALISHIASLKSSLPIIHFFDGFRTSHEIQKIEEINDEELKKLLPYKEINEFKMRALDPKHPHQSGTAQNPDVYFQNREACNLYYEEAFNIINETMIDFEKKVGRTYRPYEYYGDVKAENIIVVIGSAAKTIIDVIEKIKNNTNFSKLGKIGILNVRVYRPFNSYNFINSIPKTVKNLTVLDRTKESGSVGEPLYLDVVASLIKFNFKCNVFNGRYGLGSKEFDPKCVIAVYENMIDNNKKTFTVGIDDDVTNKSLSLNSNLIDEYYKIDSKDQEFIFYGLGSDGTISANKNSIKVIGDLTNKYVQGYFEYDSKKSGSLTVSHLRLSDNPINKAYEIEKADYIAIHNFSFINKFNILNKLKNNGAVILNTVLDEKDLNNELPNDFKKQLLEKNATLYIVDAEKIAKSLGLGNKINVIMQSCFFYTSKILNFENVRKELIQAIKKTYSKKGEIIVNSNIKAIDSYDKIKQIDLNKLTYIDEIENKKVKINFDKTNELSFAKNIMQLILKREGNDLPVSAFNPDGTVPTNTSQFEKRGISLNCPNWNSKNCIQCGRCVMACPHGALRAVLVEEGKLNDAPKDFITEKAFGVENCKYRIQLSPLDCTGCGVCANVCPAKNKALTMSEQKNLKSELINYEYSKNLENKESNFDKFSTKGIQFYNPYFEFSGACAGCGETPYIKLLTQLYGDNLIIANATGCSSIYGGSFPSCPYSKNKNGEGPAWANSLFEDNAEFGLGIKLGKNINKCKSSVWIIGGDGWAYDIGYGGLDHVLNSKENINILVLDTEVYSNTGGQASKSTPTGAIAKFASGGKGTKKKDLATIAVMSKNAYVAKVSMGANYEKTIKAFKEAEEFDGPSLVIAYAPCVNHGIDMSKTQEEMKKAVDSGYWDLFRYNPKNDELIIDSNDPTISYEEFIMGESRFSSLAKVNPEKAKELFEKSKKEAIDRMNLLKKLSK